MLSHDGFLFVFDCEIQTSCHNFAANMAKSSLFILLTFLSCSRSIEGVNLDQQGYFLKEIFDTKSLKEALFDSLTGSEQFGAVGLESNISDHCQSAAKRLYKDTVKLIKYIDAVGKPPNGVLAGNLAWLGSFDACQEDSLEAKYCISSIVIEIFTNISLPGVVGGCFPKACQTSDVEEAFRRFVALANPQIQNYHLQIGYGNHTVCPVKPEYTVGAKVTLVLCAVLLLLCLIGTIIDLAQGYTDGRSPTRSTNNIAQGIHVNRTNTASVSDIRDFNKQTSDITAPLTPNSHTAIFVRKHPVSACLDVLLCFSILRNTSKIFDTKVPAVAITSVNGVRVISMFWVIFGHTFLFFATSSLMENPVSVHNDIKKFSMMVIANAYFSVDSFFFVSGLLAAYTALRKLEKSEGRFNWPIFYLHRYFRLTPCMMFVILFYTKLMPHLTYSPLWSLTADKNCGKYWWTNLLYINNFYPGGFTDECLGWTWYLANDMQFFVITPLFLVATYRYGFRGLLASAGSLLVISLIVTATLIGHYDIDVMALGNFDTSKAHQAMQQQFEDKIYVKPYCRIQPYLVGFFLGYFLHRSYSGTKKPGWVVASVCWSVAAATALSLVYAPYNTVKEGGRTWSTAENVLYGSLERFLWGLVLTWVVYACHNGYGGLVQRFLSARFWIPLSRLTYSAYLVHPLVLVFIFSGAKSTMFYSPITISYYFISAVVLSYGTAFILAVVVEFSCDNLENLAMRASRKIR